jgi:hypothetical protein
MLPKEKEIAQLKMDFDFKEIMAGRFVSMREERREQIPDDDPLCDLSLPDSSFILLPEGISSWARMERTLSGFDSRRPPEADW